MLKLLTASNHTQAFFKDQGDLFRPTDDGEALPGTADPTAGHCSKSPLPCSTCAGRSAHSECASKLSRWESINGCKESSDGIVKFQKTAARRGSLPTGKRARTGCNCWLLLFLIRGPLSAYNCCQLLSRGQKGNLNVRNYYSRNKEQNR